MTETRRHFKFIELLLFNELAIIEAISIKRDIKRGFKPIRAAQGRISDPTALQAIKNTDPIKSVTFLSKRRVVKLNDPIAWLELFEEARTKFGSPLSSAIFYQRYILERKTGDTLEDLQISRATYHNRIHRLTDYIETIAEERKLL